MGDWLERRRVGCFGARSPEDGTRVGGGAEPAVSALVTRLETLRETLLQCVADKRGVHAETVLAAAGALAGRAALEAALVRAAAATERNGRVDADALMLVSASASESFVVGNDVSEHLYGRGDTLAHRIADAAETCGTALADLPGASSLAAAATSALGSPEFGRLDVPDTHQPLGSSRAAIVHCWPIVAATLRDAPFGPAHSMLVDPLNWPRQLGIVAAQLIEATATAVAPAVGFRLVMGSALVAAKYHPDAAEPGRWRLEARDGALRVSRTCEV